MGSGTACALSHSTSHQTLTANRNHGFLIRKERNSLLKSELRRWTSASFDSGKPRFEPRNIIPCEFKWTKISHLSP